MADDNEVVRDIEEPATRACPGTIPVNHFEDKDGEEREEHDAYDRGYDSQKLGDILAGVRMGPLEKSVGVIMGSRNNVSTKCLYTVLYTLHTTILNTPHSYTKYVRVQGSMPTALHEVHTVQP